MRRPATILLLVALLAGCGGDEGGDNSDDALTALSFGQCFDLAGYEAVKPKPREQSVLAFQAEREGYDVEAVNVQKEGMLTPHAFLVFFESAEKAKEAMEKLNATAYGDVPPQQLGPAVIGYGDKENKAAVGPAIEKCF